MDTESSHVKSELEKMVGVEHTKKVEKVGEPYRGNLIYYLFRDSKQWTRRGLQMLIDLAVRYFGSR